MQLIPHDEKMKYVDEMESMGIPFRPFWGISNVYYTVSIPTACVQQSGEELMIKINPNFFAKFTHRGKLFILTHEILHVVLNHFERLNFADGDCHNKNIAADIAINHMCENAYGFDRVKDVYEWNKAAWVDTVFVEHDHIPTNKTALYYYNLIKSDPKNVDITGVDGLDEALEGPLDLTPEQQEIIDGILDKIKRDIGDVTNFDDDYYEPSGDKEHPTELATGSQTYDFKKKSNLAWRRLMEQMVKRSYNQIEHQQWINPDRRFSVCMSNSDLILPGNYTTERPNRVKVLVYLDTSGSCITHARKFLQHALQLPPNLFDYQIFGFCEKVYDISPTPPYNLKGFGCENYRAVQRHVEQQGNVDNVFVFTDGYSTMIRPPHPEKWTWLICPKGNQKGFDPKSRVVNLSDYGWEQLQ